MKFQLQFGFKNIPKGFRTPKNKDCSQTYVFFSVLPGSGIFYLFPSPNRNTKLENWNI